jgi:hypothetical protein
VAPRYMHPLVPLLEVEVVATPLVPEVPVVADHELGAPLDPVVATEPSTIEQQPCSQANWPAALGAGQSEGEAHAGALPQAREPLPVPVVLSTPLLPVVPGPCPVVAWLLVWVEDADEVAVALVRGEAVVLASDEVDDALSWGGARQAEVHSARRQAESVRGFMIGRQAKVVPENIRSRADAWRIGQGEFCRRRTRRFTGEAGPPPDK